MLLQVKSSDIGRNSLAIDLNVILFEYSIDILYLILAEINNAKQTKGAANSPIYCFSYT